MTNTKKKLIFNIIIIALIAILAILTLILVLNKNYEYRLDYGKVLFYSDNNIFDDLSMLKDANLVLIAFDNTQTAHIASLIQYIQVFTIYNKQTNFYIMSENECIFSDTNTRAYNVVKKEECESFLQNINYTKIILGNINTKLTKTTIYIENNTYKIVSNSKESFNEYSKFLEILYPDYTERLFGLEEFTSDITKKIS